MLRWKVIFSLDAQDDLDNLSRSVRDRVFDKLGWFENNFDSITPLLLTGKFNGFYKLRVGDWRVMYQIDWNKNYIIIHVIDHRSNIYK
ncbi:MAG: plasmid stabilization system-related protein [Parcubacteria group bacterium GW2011_GWF2_39_8b]|nr:MAG: plasmid stabilization system-related protein [Parcubacteria group bacterium GW2011_GWF2_39_8b]KKR46230.1 MAG: plasmid stabilization system-related protein [Parcubacteria group bacterium GW2011_GWA2_40_14]